MKSNIYLFNDLKKLSLRFILHILNFENLCLEPKFYVLEMVVRLQLGILGGKNVQNLNHFNDKYF